jgi:hypothetical protein
MEVLLDQVNMKVLILIQHQYQADMKVLNTNTRHVRKRDIPVQHEWAPTRIVGNLLE